MSSKSVSCTRRDGANRDLGKLVRQTRQTRRPRDYRARATAPELKLQETFQVGCMRSLEDTLNKEELKTQSSNQFPSYIAAMSTDPKIQYVFPAFIS